VVRAAVVVVVSRDVDVLAPEAAVVVVD